MFSFVIGNNFRDIGRIIAGVKMRLFSRVSIWGRLARGATWSFFGSAFSQVLIFAGVAIAARILGPTDYGQVTLIQNTVLLIALLAAPSFGLTASRYLALNREGNREASGMLISTLLMLGAVVPTLFAIAFSIFYPLLKGQFTAVQVLSNNSFLFSVLFILSAFNSVQAGVMSGFEDFKGIAIANMAKGISTVVGVPLAAQYAGVSGAICALVFASAVGVISSSTLLNTQMKRHGIPRAKPNLMMVKDPLIRFTLPATLSTLITLPIMWLPNVLLAQQQNGLHELGLFNAANQWRMGVVMVFSLLTAPLLPIFSSMYGSRDCTRFVRAFWMIILSAGLVSTAIAACTYILGARITTTVFGEGYRDATSCLVILTLSTVFSNVSGILGAVLQTFNYMWAALLVNLLWSVVFGLVCFRMLAQGSQGIALAFIAAYYVQMVACGVFLFPKLKSFKNMLQVPV